VLIAPRPTLPPSLNPSLPFPPSRLRSDPVEAFLPPRQSVAPLYGFVVVRDEGRNLKEAFALEG